MLEFFKRHKNKLLAVCGIAGAGYLLTSFLRSKIVELQRQLFEDQLARENVLRRIAQSHDSAIAATHVLIPDLAAALEKSLNPAHIIALIRQRKTLNSGSTDEIPVSDTLLHGDSACNMDMTTSELWLELLIVSFARYHALLHAITMLAILQTCSTAMLARQKYLDSILFEDPLEDAKSEQKSYFSRVLSSSSNSNRVTIRTEKLFLAMSWHFIQTSVPELCKSCLEASRKALAGISSLKTAVTEAELRELNDAIIQSLEHPHSSDVSNLRKKLPKLMLPDERHETEVLKASGCDVSAADVNDDAALRSLFNQLRDVTESSLFAHTLSVIRNDVYSHSITQIINSMKNGREDDTISTFLPAEKKFSESLLKQVDGEKGVLMKALNHPSLRGMANFLFSQYGDICAV